MTYNHKQYAEMLSILELMRDDAKQSFFALAERMDCKLIIADGPANLREYKPTWQDPFTTEEAVCLDLAAGTVRIDNSWTPRLHKALQRIGVPHEFESGENLQRLTMNIHFAKKYLETAVDGRVDSFGALAKHQRKTGEAERRPKPDDRWLREHAQAKAARENLKHSR